MKTLENALVKPTNRKKTDKRPAKALPARPATQEQVARRSALAAPAQPSALAPAPTAPETVNVAFSILAPQARRVSLCGEFNGWSQEANPMQPRAEGHWQTTLALKPGRYQYKFLADGQWTADPQAKENVLNEHGTLNSVIEVRQKT
ncbi:MAG: glycogen-binding domain-containing protein [Verrucomicrobiota bacterium]